MFLCVGIFFCKRYVIVLIFTKKHMLIMFKLKKIWNKMLTRQDKPISIYHTML